MKNRLFLLGIAVAALSSCSNEELTDVAQNRAIKFNPFVNNNTKAVTELNTKGLSSFYVFGNFKTTNGSDNYEGNKIFNNEKQDTPYYWVTGKTYIFGAYADGDGGNLPNASFSAQNKTLTFPSYTPNDTKDLVAAISEEVSCTNATSQSKVNLSFKHMLSQVKFTFKTTDAESYTLKISELKLHAAKTGTGTYDLTNGVKWDLGEYAASTTDTDNQYTYNEVSDVSSASYTPQSKLVIPQSGTDKLSVTFKAKISGHGLEKEATFKATLGVNENIAGSSSAANTWIPGCRYNYTATINGDDIDPSLEQQKIEFTPTVSDWLNTNPAETETTPQKQNP